MRQLLSDLGIKQTAATLAFEGNQSAIYPQFHGRAKHVDINYHFVREKVTKRNIELKHCRTEDMVTDMVTAPITRSSQKLDTCLGFVQGKNHVLASKEECLDLTLLAHSCRPFSDCMFCLLNFPKTVPILIFFGGKEHFVIFRKERVILGNMMECLPLPEHSEIALISSSCAKYLVFPCLLFPCFE